jgi:hypothetical protein
VAVVVGLVLQDKLDKMLAEQQEVGLVVMAHLLLFLVRLLLMLAVAVEMAMDQAH